MEEVNPEVSVLPFLTLAYVLIEGKEIEVLIKYGEIALYHPP